MLNRLRIIERIDICRTHMRMSGAKLNHNRWPKNHALRPKGHRKRRLTVKKVSESACKPGSVKNSHSSGMYVAIHLKQPTRIQRGSRHADSYLVLLRVGFTMPQTVASCAVRSYRTLSPLPLHPKMHLGGLLSAALSVGSRPPGVTWHSTLWSPDFPP